MIINKGRGVPKIMLEKCPCLRRPEKWKIIQQDKKCYFSGKQNLVEIQHFLWCSLLDLTCQTPASTSNEDEVRVRMIKDVESALDGLRAVNDWYEIGGDHHRGYQTLFCRKAVYIDRKNEKERFKTNRGKLNKWSWGIREKWMIESGMKVMESKRHGYSLGKHWNERETASGPSASHSYAGSHFSVRWKGMKGTSRRCIASILLIEYIKLWTLTYGAANKISGPIWSVQSHCTRNRKGWSYTEKAVLPI